MVVGRPIKVILVIKNISTCVYATLEGFVQQKKIYRESGRFIIKSENREKSLGQVGEFI